MLKPRAPIAALSAYHAPAAGRTGLNLDLNENTGGCSPRVLRKLASLSAQDISRYPDRDAGERIAARFFRVASEQVLLTNGVDEGLHLLASAYLDNGDEAVVVQPTFTMYAIYFAAEGAKIVSIFADRDAGFAFPLDKVLGAITPKTRIIAIANPNNPTGTVVDRESILRLAEAAPNAAVIADEAYFEFYGQTVLDALPRYPNLFVTRTFSKAYGLAGLRVGAIIGETEQIGYLKRFSSPFNVNAVALAALPLAIGDGDFVANYVRQVIDGRTRLQSACTELGIRFWPSSANFVLVEVGPRHRKFVEAMAQRGFLVRDRSSDPGCQGCVRITIGTSEQNPGLIDAVRQCVREIGAAKVGA